MIFVSRLGGLEYYFFTVSQLPHPHNCSDPNSSAGVIIVNDVIYSDIAPFTGKLIPKEKEEMKAQPKPAGVLSIVCTIWSKNTF